MRTFASDKSLGNRAASVEAGVSPIEGLEKRNGVTTVLGTITYNNRPFATHSNIEVVLSDVTGQNRIVVPNKLINPAAGTFSMPGVPVGVYDISIKTGIGDPPNYNPYPGDYWGQVDAFAVTENSPARVSIAAWLIIHLKSPVENVPPEPLIPPPYAMYDSPITFAWDRIPEASTYLISLEIRTDDSFACIRWRSETVSQTSLAVPLPASRPGEHYQLQLRALNERQEAVGILYVTYRRSTGGIFGFSGDCRFKIRQKNPKP